MERLERDLRTTIPATIQKARELGDLKENAEYHSAKLKQANVSKQVASLQLRLTRARFVEEAELKDVLPQRGHEQPTDHREDRGLHQNQPPGADRSEPRHPRLLQYDVPRIGHGR